MKRDVGTTTNYCILAQWHSQNRIVAQAQVGRSFRGVWGHGDRIYWVFRPSKCKKKKSKVKPAL